MTATDGQLHARSEREGIPLGDLLYRQAIHLSQNHSDAEELVQETVMRAYGRCYSFRSDTNLNGWLFGILIDAVIKGHRRMRRQPVHYSTEQYLTEAKVRSAASTLHSADDHVLAVLPDNDIKAVVQALPEQFREAVYYADMEGLRHNEIAVLMNTPRGTVMSRLHRGRRQLRTLLGPQSTRLVPSNSPRLRDPMSEVQRDPPRSFAASMRTDPLDAQRIPIGMPETQLNTHRHRKDS